MYSIKQLAKLTRKSYRDQEGVFLAEGKKIIEEAKNAKADIIQIMATRQFQKLNTEYLRQFGTHQPVVEISDSNLARLSGTKTPPGIIAVIKKPTVKLEDILQHQQLAIFEDIKDPGNLGTMLRTADWFGVTGIIVSSAGVDPYNDKVLRATMGSHFHQHIFTSKSLSQDLNTIKRSGYHLIVSTLRQKSAQGNQQPSDKWALIMGNESNGVSQAVERLADSFYTIPGKGQAESLNVAVSFGIILNNLTT
ncbi:MAG TPA: RNA methyltransferase [Patescibacteria group bacterium]